MNLSSLHSVADLIKSEHRFYRLDAYHSRRTPMDELVLGYSEAKELADEWKADGWEVELSIDFDSAPTLTEA